MDSTCETFLMCFTISAISVLTSFIPKGFVLKIYGISMGLAAGALCAVLFADLFPEFLEKFTEKMEGIKNHDEEHFYGRLFSGLFLGGVFLGGLVEAVVHFFMPHDHCHGHATGHCKHGEEHHHSVCLDDAITNSHDKSHHHSHGHGHGHGHSHCHENPHSHDDKSYSIQIKTNDVEKIVEKENENNDGKSSFSSDGLKVEEQQTEETGAAGTEMDDEDEEQEKSNTTSSLNWFSQLLYINSQVWLYTICRALHLVSDGVVIGMAKNWIIVLGLLAHELPHCLGSYGFYINYKVSRSHSIFLLVSSCLGFFIGNSLVIIVDVEKVELYFLSIIIGMFLYVVFLIILPETMAVKDKKDALYRFLTFIISLVLISFMIYKYHSHGDDDHDHGPDGNH